MAQEPTKLATLEHSDTRIVYEKLQLKKPEYPKKASLG